MLGQRNRRIVVARVVWSTNLVTLAVYVHRIPCRCSSGSHREGTVSVHTRGHDVGNPYKGGGVGLGGPLRCEASPKALAMPASPRFWVEPSRGVSLPPPWSPHLPPPWSPLASALAGVSRSPPLTAARGKE